MFRDVEQLPDFPAIEREILRFWEMERPFEARVEKNRKGKAWSFYDGPITANNPMGVHHAWGRTYKDIFQRYKAMLGFRQRYQNGFDCQGLWVEVEVEKELGLNSKKEITEYGLDRFAERCRSRVRNYARRQTQQSTRLGQWMHWDDSYYTMDDRNISTIWHFLKVCRDKGWLYQGHRSMPWCWRCGSSLSQHELADSYKELTHRAVFFTVAIDGPVNEHLLVWTTTPWTLTANVAAAVHPEMDYVKVKQGDRILILAAAAKDRALEGPYEVVETIKGEALVGLTYSGPTDVPPRADIQPRVIPWPGGVTGDEGTGIVHIAPGCGAEDFELSKVHELPVIVPIDEGGCFTAEMGEFATKHALHAPDQVFAHLQAQGSFYRVEEYTHRYPVCWRCKEELVFRVVDEWFIAVDEIRPKMIAQAEAVEWVPEYAGKRMIDWLNNMGDWCISRKRFWGLPLPFYPCETCDTVVQVGSPVELAEMAVSGMDQLSELHRPWIDHVKIKCPGCGATLERIPEVGDCWLDAGIIPFSTVPGYFEDRESWAEWFPADFITEMVEQVRLWFYATMFMSVTLEGTAPYRKVQTYESVVDEHGVRGSKTLMNLPDFDTSVERMGADVMRWMYASAPTDRNLRFGFNIGDEARRRLLTLWNTYRFFCSYASIDQPKKLGAPLSSTNLKDSDRWILARLQELVGTCREHLDAFDTARLVRAADEFITDLSNGYVRANRQRFWRNENDKDKQVAFGTLYCCLKTLIGLLAPVLPFMTEKMYQNLVRRAEEESPPSVHLMDYPDVELALGNPTIIEDMRAVAKACEMGHAVRAKSRLRTRQPLREVIICVTGAALERGIQTFSSLIQQELNVKTVKLLGDLAQIQTYKVKPNFSVLGRKYGADMPRVQAAIAALDQRDTAMAVLAGRQVSVPVDGERVKLSPDELIVEPCFASHLIAIEDQLEGSKITVVLNTRLSPELEQEGLARDFIRHIQQLRKTSDYRITDRIEIQHEGAGDVLSRAIEVHDTLIRGETLANKLDGALQVTFRDRATVKIGEDEVTIGTLRRY